MLRWWPFVSECNLKWILSRINSKRNNYGGHDNKQAMRNTCKKQTSRALTLSLFYLRRRLLRCDCIGGGAGGDRSRRQGPILDRTYASGSNSGSSGRIPSVSGGIADGALVRRNRGRNGRRRRSVHRWLAARACGLFLLLVWVFWFYTYPPYSCVSVTRNWKKINEIDMQLQIAN